MNEVMMQQPESEAVTNSNGTRVEGSRWHQAAPWILTITSLLVLSAIGWFLVENVLWFRGTAFSDATATMTTYRLHMHHLHLAMIKRSVGLFSGFALLFLGLSIVFYTLRDAATLDVAHESLTAKLVTVSPGLVAMVLAVVILVSSISQRDSFAEYRGESNGQAPTTETAIVNELPEHLKGKQ